MHWLITVPAGTDIDALDQVLRSADGALRDLNPVPMGPDQVVVFAEGPSNLPRRIDPATVPVLEIHPDSEPEPY